MKACVIIPARFASTRFPGKPLVLLNNKPMVIWVAEGSASAVGKENVYIATDDKKIADAVNSYGFQYLMTSPNCLTGTDRVAEASLQINYDIIINVQGDEPLVRPNDILNAISLKKSQPSFVVNGFTPITVSEDAESLNIPKLVINESNTLLYMSRSLIPGTKDSGKKPHVFLKQVCIYAFSPDDLRLFSSFGRKSMLESYEDIEILRFFDLNRQILMFECTSGSLAVDIPEDVTAVEDRLSQLNQ
ncbi:3-deoxy-manno-octulosonate cytidylyltransferase [bacterium]|nr:3-deoxy-manno-octulosonate cytidylyltransferase [bacterium]